MVTCPECNGKKVESVQISQYWEEKELFELVKCPTCKGKGKVHELSLAIYKARENQQLTLYIKVLA